MPYTSRNIFLKRDELMELIFLGTSAGVPTRTRNVTAILLNLQHPTQSGLWLFDCGEGTQHQLLHTAFNPSKTGQDFISHLHGDHLLVYPACCAVVLCQALSNP